MAERFWLDDEADDKAWTLADIYADLGSITDVAAHLNVTVWRAEAWVHRRERIACPEPVTTIARTYIYSKQEWADWFARWKADPKRARWMDNPDINKPNGSGVPFFDLNGPDRGWRTRRTIRARQAKAAATAEDEAATD